MSASACWWNMQSTFSCWCVQRHVITAQDSAMDVHHLPSGHFQGCCSILVLTAPGLSFWNLERLQAYERVRRLRIVGLHVR
eukprot:3565565-Amphidinium_carterae.1